MLAVERDSQDTLRWRTMEHTREDVFGDTVPPQLESRTRHYKILSSGGATGRPRNDERREDWLRGTGATGEAGSQHASQTDETGALLLYRTPRKGRANGSGYIKGGCRTR